MKKKEIEELQKIKTEQDIFNLYPKAKLVQSKLSHVFYKIKPKTFIKCYYLMKDGSCCRKSNILNTDDVDYDKISLHLIYVVSRNNHNHINIWSYDENN